MLPDFSFLFAEFMSMPLWMWLVFITLVFTVLIFDLKFLNRNDHAIEIKESLLLAAFYISIGMAFGGWVFWELGKQSGIEYVTGFIVEESLSIDNIFVMAVMFKFFSIPRQYQHRVLFWGIMGVIILRAIMIGLGTTLVARCEWILYVFALFLVVTGYKLLVMTEAVQHFIKSFKGAKLCCSALWVAACGVMAYAASFGLHEVSQGVQATVYGITAITALFGVKIAFSENSEEHDIDNNPLLIFLRRHLPVTDKLHGHDFLVRHKDPKSGKMKLFITPLLLALIMIELADIVFAVDSVPAVFSITTNPFIVYTSNIFAVLGLRALYFALAAMMDRFAYLKYALSLVLIFIGSKIFITDLMGWEKFPALWSLLITFALLASGFAFSLWKTDKHHKA